MTNGDKIRSMSDEELATLISGIMASQRAEMIARLRMQGVIVEAIEAPLLSAAAHLKWLREPAEGGNYEQGSFDIH